MWDAAFTKFLLKAFFYQKSKHLGSIVSVNNYKYAI